LIRELAGFSERRRLLKGEILFEAGDGVDEHIFVLSGRLQITKPRTDGAVNLVAVVGAVRSELSCCLNIVLPDSGFSSSGAPPLQANSVCVCCGYL
jgi:CRP-like cAMP-binding protein